jgi:hypothetical protein
MNKILLQAAWSLVSGSFFTKTRTIVVVVVFGSQTITTTPSVHWKMLSANIIFNSDLSLPLTIFYN